MLTTVDGVKWRLRFHHHRLVRGKGGSTRCSIEQWVRANTSSETEGWLTHTEGVTICGRKDNFTKETGRQYALLRALQTSGLGKATKAALITAYLKSGNHDQRTMCDDLWRKTHTGNFYHVGLSEAKEMRV